MNPSSTTISVRLALIASDRSGAYALTGLDASKRRRCLPIVQVEIPHQQSIELALIKYFGPQLAAKISWTQQMGANNQDGHIHINMLGLVCDHHGFSIPTTDWWNIFDLYPWEDWRKGPPSAIAQKLRPQLQVWAQQQTASIDFSTQIARCFPNDPNHWKHELIDQRYALLYQAGLLPEALRDRSGAAISVRHQHVQVFGQTMAGNDRQQLAKAIARMRQYLAIYPLAASLLTGSFSLGTLQKILENQTGTKLHTQNFRRDVLQTGLLTDCHLVDTQSPGRPAKLYKWSSLAEPISSAEAVLPLPRKKI